MQMCSAEKRRRIRGKRLFCGLLTVILTLGTCLSAWAKPDWPADTGIMAEAGIVVDADSGAVLFGQQIHVPFAPASITKLLTALVVAEQAPLDETVLFSHDAVYNVESGSGNSLSLDEGDHLSVEDCLYSLLLRSSNQAANALAEHVAGSRQAFVDMMNAKIQELGCTESQFANPSGLNDENQYVTAYDMAIIARAAFANDTVLRIASAKSHRIPATKNNPEGLSFTMEHRLLITEDTESQFYLEGALAGKTGYTSIAGNTLVTCAERDGRRLISVILKGTQPQYYLDGKTILDFGFASFKNEQTAGQETFLTEDHGYSQEAYALSDGVITLPNGASFSDAERSLTEELPADAPEDAVAMLQYTYNDRKIGSAYILDKNGRASSDLGDDGAETILPLGENQDADGADEGGDLQPEQPEKDGIKTQKEKKSWGIGGVILVIVLILLALLAAFGGFVWYQEKKEAEARARRRKRRMERLLESGITQEEFERLLAQRRSSHGGGSSAEKSVKNSRKK